MGTHDTDADTGADTVWLTYVELGRARGTNAAAAKRLAMRRRWRRQAGNDGTTRVSVPVSEAQHWKGDTGAHTDVSPGVNTDVDTPSFPKVISILEAAVATLGERAIEAEKRADRAETRAEQAESRANEAERALAEADKRSDRLELAQGRLEGELEAAKIAQGEAEADAAELRDRMAKNMEEAEAELRRAEGAVQKAEHDRIAAVAIADEAVRAAEELRQAQTARVGQGRWQRLRAAWRGD